jgi:hypothetical protein
MKPTAMMAAALLLIAAGSALATPNCTPRSIGGGPQPAIAQLDAGCVVADPVLDLPEGSKLELDFCVGTIASRVSLRRQTQGWLITAVHQHAVDQCPAAAHDDH